MVLNQQASEVVLEGARLLSSQAVDLLEVRAESVDGLPAADWVGADDRMLGGELLTDVLWSTALGGVDLELNLDGLGLGEGGSESIEKLLAWSRDAVVELVSGAKEGDATGLWELGHGHGRTA